MSENRPDDPNQGHPSEVSKTPGGQRPASERIPNLKSPASQPTRRSERVQRPAANGEQTVKRPAVSDIDSEVDQTIDSGLYVPWWGFVIVILAVATITCGMWWLVLANRGDVATGLGPTPTPIFVVITATPTLGASQENTDQAAEPTTTPVDIPQPTQTSLPVGATEIQIGSTIAITGTEGDGLAVRQGPGLDYAYFFVAYDGDRFVVENGPRDVDGYVWWYVTDPADADRAGWAAANWIELVQP